MYYSDSNVLSKTFIFRLYYFCWRPSENYKKCVLFLWCCTKKNCSNQTDCKFKSEQILLFTHPNIAVSMRKYDKSSFILITKLVQFPKCTKSDWEFQLVILGSYSNVYIWVSKTFGNLKVQFTSFYDDLHRRWTHLRPAQDQKKGPKHLYGITGLTSLFYDLNNKIYSCWRDHEKWTSALPSFVSVYVHWAFFRYLFTLNPMKEWLKYLYNYKPQFLWL